MLPLNTDTVGTLCSVLETMNPVSGSRP